MRHRGGLAPFATHTGVPPSSSDSVSTQRPSRVRLPDALGSARPPPPSFTPPPRLYRGPPSPRTPSLLPRPPPASSDTPVNKIFLFGLHSPGTPGPPGGVCVTRPRPPLCSIRRASSLPAETICCLWFRRQPLHTPSSPAVGSRLLHRCSHWGQVRTLRGGPNSPHLRGFPSPQPTSVHTPEGHVRLSSVRGVGGPSGPGRRCGRRGRASSGPGPGTAPARTRVPA